MGEKGRGFLVILCLCLPLFVHSQCNRKPVVFNFGDSNSDTGGYSIGLGLNFGPPNGRTFFHQPSGRLCDGRLIIDFLCKFDIFCYSFLYDPCFSSFSMSLELVTESRFTERKGKKKSFREKDPLQYNKFTLFKILSEVLLYIYIYIYK